MRQHDSNRTRQVVQKVMQFAGGLFALVYIICGYFVIKLKWFMTNLDEYIAYSLGILLIVYGIYRGFRTYQNLKDLMD
ncbi:MAG: hypothetical protein ACK4NY_06115 [Spirosomataceae bacterium]